MLFVASYLADGIALRRQQVAQHLRLAASVGTSSSYCLEDFGAALRRDAVGLFASDKPDAHAPNPNGLRPEARTLLTRADAAYRTAYGGSMSAAALAGFSGTWALLRWVLPHATSMRVEDLSRAARQVDIPDGGLPNGAGVSFGRPRTAVAGANLRAASVIWEWTGVNRREVAWPPQFATAPIRVLPIT